MGSIHSAHLRHLPDSWESEYGCDHYDGDTTIDEIKWKVVPISDEEAQIVYRRLMKLAGVSAFEATSGLRKEGIEASQEVVQVGTSLIIILTFYF